ncbi:MAG: branched-chain amino acid ABC transporter permease [candidate division Zixibacteria bacterium]|nr:branched-chain amino acid ABC transporter permease [candidate division Zixibacteria bacterium]
MQEFLQQLVNGITWGSIYALIALGYTMVYGVLKLINFAHGDVYMVGAFVGYYSARWFGVDKDPNWLGALLVILTAMVVCAGIGVLIERFAYKPLRNRPKLTALITAIGISLLLENLCQLVFGADPKFFPQIVQVSQINVGGVILTSQQLIVVISTLLLLGILQYIVHNTTTGKAMRAVSFNRQAASLMGIPVDRIIAFTFVLGSAFAGAAGVLVALTNPKIDPLMGLLPGLKAFVAAVLGGIGNIGGAMLGGYIMGITEVMVVGYVSSTFRDAVAFGILIVILILKPTGLLGLPDEDKV